ncbi:MAG: nucleoside deaminase [Cyclobacteriaceae bacterium]
MASETDQQFMQLAIEQAEEGKTPFGCVIIAEGTIIAQAYNTVSASHDVSAHGEINAIRAASLLLQNHLLESTTLYTTGEPCPMCMAAIIYAKIPRVVYGASITTISQFMSQISISSQEVVNNSGREVELVGPFMEAECINLLKRFG